MRYYSDDLIAKRVSKKVKERTQENMDVYCMDLYEAFKEAAHTYAKAETELYKAWYYDDFRKYIPSAYRKDSLNFKEYPLLY